MRISLNKMKKKYSASSSYHNGMVHRTSEKSMMSLIKKHYKLSQNDRAYRHKLVFFMVLHFPRLTNWQSYCECTDFLSIVSVAETLKISMTNLAGSC